jgi:hypothetical protein
MIHHFIGMKLILLPLKIKEYLFNPHVLQEPIPGHLFTLYNAAQGKCYLLL